MLDYNVWKHVLYFMVLILIHLTIVCVQKNEWKGNNVSTRYSNRRLELACNISPCSSLNSLVCDMRTQCLLSFNSFVCSHIFHSLHEHFCTWSAASALWFLYTFSPPKMCDSNVLCSFHIALLYNLLEYAYCVRSCSVSLNSVVCRTVLLRSCGLMMFLISFSFARSRSHSLGMFICVFVWGSVYFVPYELSSSCSWRGRDGKHKLWNISAISTLDTIQSSTPQEKYVYPAKKKKKKNSSSHRYTQILSHTHSIQVFFIWWFLIKRSNRESQHHCAS